MSLGRSWGALDPFGGPLGASWGPLRGLLGRLGALWGTFWGALGLQNRAQNRLPGPLGSLLEHLWEEKCIKARTNQFFASFWEPNPTPNRVPNR